MRVGRVVRGVHAARGGGYTACGGGRRCLHEICSAPPLRRHLPLPSQEPGVGRAALAACADTLQPYTTCAELHLTARQRELVPAPQLYREKAAAALGR